MKRSRISDDKIAEIYEKKGGNLTATAIALGVSRRTLERWKNKKKKLAELLSDTDESLIDFAETKLKEAINDGNMTAVLFFLKTKGKKRGYVEQVDQNVTVSPFEEMLKSLPDNPKDLDK